MKQIILLLFIAVMVLFIYVINGESPCEHLKGQSYNDVTYHECQYNWQKGL